MTDVAVFFLSSFHGGHVVHFCPTGFCCHPIILKLVETKAAHVSFICPFFMFLPPLSLLVSESSATRPWAFFTC